MQADWSMPIQGISMRRIQSQAGSYWLMQSEQPLRTLCSTPWGGGFGEHTCLVNRQVDKHYDAADPLAEMQAFLRLQGLDPAATAAMMTAARVEDAGYSALSWEAQTDAVEAGTSGEAGSEVSAAAEPPLRVYAWVTAGLGNPARAGRTLPAAAVYPGTINTIVLADAALTDAAMVNAVITATEAKSAALQDLNARLPAAGEDVVATGTTTDAILIAATQRGRVRQYAGTATQLGYLVGRTVYEATVRSGQRYHYAGQNTKT